MGMKIKTKRICTRFWLWCINDFRAYLFELNPPSGLELFCDLLKRPVLGLRDFEEHENCEEDH